VQVALEALGFAQAQVEVAGLRVLPEQPLVLGDGRRILLGTQVVIGQSQAQQGTVGLGQLGLEQGDGLIEAALGGVGIAQAHQGPVVAGQGALVQLAEQRLGLLQVAFGQIQGGQLKLRLPRVGMFFDHRLQLGAGLGGVVHAHQGGGAQQLGPEVARVQLQHFAQNVEGGRELALEQMDFRQPQPGRQIGRLALERFLELRPGLVQLAPAHQGPAQVEAQHGIVGRAADGGLQLRHRGLHLLARAGFDHQGGAHGARLVVFGVPLENLVQQGGRFGPLALVHQHLGLQLLVARPAGAVLPGACLVLP